jgi:hypothetical protein
MMTGIMIIIIARSLPTAGNKPKFKISPDIVGFYEWGRIIKKVENIF